MLVKLMVQNGQEWVVNAYEAGDLKFQTIFTGIAIHQPVWLIFCIEMSLIHFIVLNFKIWEMGTC